MLTGVNAFFGSVNKIISFIESFRAVDYQNRDLIATYSDHLKLVFFFVRCTSRELSKKREKQSKGSGKNHLIINGTEGMYVSSKHLTKRRR